MEEVFSSIFGQALDCLPKSNHVVVHMDDTIVRKKGKKVSGVAWRRDPLGPPFRVNFVWAQRYLQLSVAVPDQTGIGSSRAIPIAFQHCPTPAKPKKDATPEDIEIFKEKQKQMKLNQVGADCIAQTRQTLDQMGLQDKKLIMCVDGSYTNSTILKNLPGNVSLIGRIRKDAKFFYPAKQQSQKGRKKIYGEALPTPEQIRQSDEYSWKKIEAWAVGKKHKFDIKEVKGVLWKKSGKDQKLRIIVIRPLAYRPTKSSKILYRKPAYLICTDDKIELQMILQYYLWRWEVEVNIGEEKSLMGVGKAHVRNPQAVINLPAFVTAIYSLLHLAEINTRNQQKASLPRPKWYKHKPDKRITTGDLRQNFKAQLYCKAVGFTFKDFVEKQQSIRSARNTDNSHIYSQFYGRVS